MRVTKIVLCVLILSLVVLTACGGIPFSDNPSRNQNRNYYQGNDGVIMRFSDINSPPSRTFYYEDAERDDNGFQILVDVHNIGSSYTHGALYVSGYDPYMIQIENIDILPVGASWTDCFFQIDWVGIFTGTGGRASGNCPGRGTFGAGQGGVQLSTRSIGQALNLEDDSFWNNVGLDLSTGPGGQTLAFNLGDTLATDIYNRGKGFIGIMLSAGLSFTQYNGILFTGDVSGTGILRPDDPDFPGGELNTVAFNGWIDKWPQGLDQTERPISFLVTSCFLYTTYATPQVCIDPAPFDQGQKVCQPRRITFNGGNGAPVAVTSIDQENTRRKIFFDIAIQNVGGGTVFEAASMEFCSPYYPGRLTTQHLNTVYILDARIGDQHLVCTPDRGDGIKLINGRGQVRCEYDMQYLSAKSAYETPLVIELGYGYSTTMQRRMNVKRVI